MLPSSKTSIVLELLSADKSENLVFHYTSALCTVTELLQSGQFRMGRLKQMNDPLEFLDKLRFFSGGVTFDLNESRRITKQLEIADRHRIERVRLDSFAQDRSAGPQGREDLFHKGWAGSRMWAQYAGSHSGVCLVFDRLQIYKAIRGKLGHTDSKNSPLIQHRVRYTDHLPTLIKHLYPNVESQFSDEEFTNWYLEKCQPLRFLKHRDFRDEHEYRYLLIREDFDPREPNFEFPISGCIKAVILGCRFPEAYRINMEHNASKFDLELFDIDWKSGRPELGLCNPA
ncbi:MAG: DUF2971 domain-containing protein [Spirochaetales bacterium]